MSGFELGIRPLGWRRVGGAFAAVVVAAALVTAQASAAASSGDVLGWGEDNWGQLGGEPFGGSDVPIMVDGLSEVTAVAGGAKYSLALLRNGTVVGWGSDGYGELGDGVEVHEQDTPIPVSGLHEVVAISAGHKFSLALLANGTVMSWGFNQFGKLGNGTNVQSSDVPVQVKGLGNVVAIAAGFFHSLALLSNGTVMAWGNGDYGELGDGATSNSNVPVAVTGLANVKAISAGGIHSLALLDNGTVMSWGGDEYGQLGLGEGVTHRTDVPVAVKGLSGASAISAGMFYNLALLGNGTVMSWGFNHSGQLGNGAVNQRTNGVPGPVLNLSGVKAIAASNSSVTLARTNQHSMALLNNGSVMGWGGNEDGQLGDGSIASSDVPMPVSGLSNVTAIAAGGFHGLAIEAGG